MPRSGFHLLYDISSSNILTFYKIFFHAINNQ